MCKWRKVTDVPEIEYRTKKAMDKSKKLRKSNKTIGSELERVKNDNALVTTEVT